MCPDSSVNNVAGNVLDEWGEAFSVSYDVQTVSEIYPLSYRSDISVSLLRDE
jgi:hypothetical protein